MRVARPPWGGLGCPGSESTWRAPNADTPCGGVRCARTATPLLLLLTSPVSATVVVVAVVLALDVVGAVVPVPSPLDLCEPLEVESPSVLSVVPLPPPQAVRSCRQSDVQV